MSDLQSILDDTVPDEKKEHKEEEILPFLSADPAVFVQFPQTAGVAFASHLLKFENGESTLRQLKFFRFLRMVPLQNQPKKTKTSKFLKCFWIERTSKRHTTEAGPASWQIKYGAAGSIFSRKTFGEERRW